MPNTSQADRRRYLRFKDQHGRVWGANVETSTMDPCEPPQPCGWTAPWLPPEPYRVVTEDPDTNGKALRLDYDRLFSDLQAAADAWQARLVDIGLKTAGDAFDETAPTPAILRLVGPKPTPVQLPAFAKAGDRWLLGDPTAARPAWADKYLPKPRTLEATILAELEAEGVESEATAPRRGRKARDAQEALV